MLEESRESTVWRKKGLVVGEIVYRITMPADKQAKGKVSEQPTENKAEKDGWCLSNTIQLSPSQSKQFISFLEQHEEKLKNHCQRKRRARQTTREGLFTYFELAPGKKS